MLGMRRVLVVVTSVLLLAGGGSVRALARPERTQKPDVRLELLATPSAARAGEDISFTVRLTNVGSTGTGATVEVPIPDGTVFRSGWSGCARDYYGAAVVRCSFPGVASDWPTEGYFVLGTRTPGTVLVSAVASTPEPDGHPADNTSAVEVALADSDAVDMATSLIRLVGGGVGAAAYTAAFSVGNVGRKAASGVRVEVFGSGISTAETTQGTCALQAGGTTCQLGRVEPGATVTVVIEGATYALPYVYTTDHYAGVLARVSSAEDELRPPDNEAGGYFRYQSPGVPRPDIPTIPCRIVVVNRCLPMM